jgi:low temperature requirement protein LtrA
MARDVFSVMHFPMLCGVIAVAAATGQALAHPDQPLLPGVRVTLGAGAALFVCATAAAVWRATGRMPLWRWMLAPAGAVAVVGLGEIPWVAMTFLLATLVAVGVVETGQASPAPRRG